MRNRPSTRWATVATVSVLVAAGLLMEGLLASGASPSRPSAGDNYQSLAEIRQGLASPRFADREAARKELEKVPPQELENLQKFLANETDPEVQSALAVQIEKLETRRLLHAEGLSIDVKDASIDDVIEALKRSMGDSLVWPLAKASADFSWGEFVPKGSWRGDLDQKRFTLKTDDMPFWEIINRLQQQSNFQIFPQRSELWFAAATAYDQQDELPRGVPQVLQRQGPVAIYAYVYNPQAAVPPQPPIPRPHWEMHFDIFSDPRMRVAAVNRRFTITSAIDDAGRPLVVAPQTILDGWIPCTSAHWLDFANLEIPPNSVKKIAQISGVLRCAVMVEDQRLVIEDIASKYGKTVSTTLGKVTVTPAKADAEGASAYATIQLDDFNLGSVPFVHDPPQSVRPGVVVRLLDQQGKAVGTFGGSPRIGDPPVVRFYKPLTLPAQGKFSLEISVPLKVREITIQVELKDIALP